MRVCLPAAMLPRLLMGRAACAPPLGRLPGTLRGAASGPLRAGVESMQELFGEAPLSRAELGPQTRTAAKRRAEEFRRLGRDLAALPPKTLSRMALPIDLAEALDEVRGSAAAPQRPQQDGAGGLGGRAEDPAGACLICAFAAHG